MAKKRRCTILHGSMQVLLNANFGITPFSTCTIFGYQFDDWHVLPAFGSPNMRYRRIYQPAGENARAESFDECQDRLTGFIGEGWFWSRGPWSGRIWREGDVSPGKGQECRLLITRRAVAFCQMQCKTCAFYFSDKAKFFDANNVIVIHSQVFAAYMKPSSTGASLRLPCQNYQSLIDVCGILFLVRVWSWNTKTPKRENVGSVKAL